MTEQMQEAKANPAAQKAKAKSHSSNTIQTSSEIISVAEPEKKRPFPAENKRIFISLI